MSDAGGQRAGTDEQDGWVSDVERRTAALRSAALGGLALGVLLLVVGAGWLQSAQSATGGASWGALVCFALAFGALGWAGLAALAFWVCRAVLDR